MKYFLIVALLALAGCATNKAELADRSTDTAVGIDVQMQPKAVWVPIDKRLTTRLVNPYPGEAKTYGEATLRSDTCAPLLDQCNAKLSEIEAVQGTEKVE